jgi:glycosyltransferase involved in cell wall biosynthesis
LKISIVTVTYNAELIIEETLSSIISQDYKYKEIIIIDGKSSDQTLHKIRRFDESIHKIISENDDGIYDAMNKGLNLATGEFVIFMNAGDLFYKSTTLTDFFKSITKKDSIYYGDAIYISDDKNNKIKRGGKFNRFRLAKTNLCHQTVFYPKSTYEAQKYNTVYKLFADWDYNMRCFKKGIDFIYINNIIAYYDNSGLSVTQRDVNFERDIKKIIYKNLGLLPIIYLGIRKFNKKFRLNKLWK